MNYKRTRLACFYTYLSLSSVFCVPPLLFVTFHDTYLISYTLLGTLVLINFCTQLAVDLIFTFFSDKFNIKLTVTVMPLLTAMGLLIFASVPTLLPKYAFWGLAAGTVVFSIGSGLSEVLISPITAAIPSENPERDMSMLHSLYAWGVLIMVTITTVFFRIFGTANWHYLILFLAVLPVFASILFGTSDIPDLPKQSINKNKNSTKIVGMLLCAACIFFGGSSENLMTSWISTFMESALSIPKDYCDIVGIALFALLLGATRTAYAKWGKNISKTLLLSFAGAFVCYIVAGVTNSPVAGAVACALTGAFTSMLWPGTLIMMEEYMPALGVSAYALMAAGGDAGASVAPQLMGIMSDNFVKTETALKMATQFSITTEQAGLKMAMLASAVFPLLGILTTIAIKRYFRKGKGNKIKE